MSTYFDTSIWLSYYLRDSSYANALALRNANPGSLWTPWQAIEFNNALRTGVVAKKIPRQIVLQVGKTLQSDLMQRSMRPHHIPVYAWWREAETLSDAHASTLGVRTLDLLHVAAARVLNATRFCTFDARQLTLAQAAGLQTN
jgi:predicted nucleic acid-binding protein